MTARENRRRVALLQVEDRQMPPGEPSFTAEAISQGRRSNGGPHLFASGLQAKRIA